MNWRWAWALILAGCATETRIRHAVTDPLCLEVAWDVLPAAAGDPMGSIPCEDTLDCPPPLTCAGGACLVEYAVRQPSAPRELYAVPEFLLSVEQSGESSVLQFDGVPAGARILSCDTYICPVDAQVLSEAPGRCRVATEVIDLALSATAVPLGSTLQGAHSLDIASAIDACDGPSTVPFSVAAVGFFTVCYAYGPTDLVAVSAITPIGVDEMGDTGRSSYQSACGRDTAIEGAACVRDFDDAISELGVCVGAGCCVPCAADVDCQPFGGSSCVAIRALGRPGGDASAGPFVGVCVDAPCIGPRGGPACTALVDDTWRLISVGETDCAADGEGE